MVDILISYGFSWKDLIAVVHPVSEKPKKIRGRNPNFYGSIYIQNSTTKIVSGLLEDFLLNTHRHLSSGGFIGLRMRCQRLFGSETNPSIFGYFPDTSLEQELYPGLKRILLDDQISYIVTDQRNLSLGSYLPHEFGQKARELASAI